MAMPNVKFGLRTLSSPLWLRRGALIDMSSCDGGISRDIGAGLPSWDKAPADGLSRCDEDLLLILFDRLFRTMIRHGPLTVIDVDGRVRVYGTPNSAVRPLTLRFTDRAVPWAVVRNPALGVGEAYMDGRLIVEGGDIADFADLIGYNLGWDVDDSVRPRRWRPRRIGTAFDGWN